MYSRLARSIAPEIWGHEDVKKVAATAERQIVVRQSAHCAGVTAAGDKILLHRETAAVCVWQRSSVHLVDVQALLLVLVGGVTKEMDDGMRLRGDIHACLMGARAGCNVSSPVACHPGWD